MRSQGPDRRLRAAAAIDGYMRDLPAANFGPGPAGPIEFAVMVERLLLGPGPAQQTDIFRGAAIACFVVGPVPVPGLIGVAAAGNDMDRETAAAQLVERRELARGKRRRNKAWAVRQQKAEPLGHRGGMRPDQKSVRRIREIADQHPVEAGPFVNTRCLGDDFGVEWRARGRDQLRRHPRRDPADHLDRHGPSPDAASCRNKLLLQGRQSVNPGLSIAQHLAEAAANLQRPICHTLSASH